MEKDFVDCIVLPYKQKSYLFPAVVIAEAILSHGEYHQNVENADHLVFLTWRDHVVPLIPLDLAPLEEVLTQTKIAIINMLDLKGKMPPYVATLAEERPRRIRIYPQDLYWSDSEHKIAKIKNTENEEEFILFDLSLFSHYIQERTT